MLTIIAQIIGGILALINHHFEAVNAALEAMKGKDAATDAEVENVKAQFAVLRNSADGSMSAFERLRQLQKSDSDTIG